jgi:hypothetical protein
MIHASTVFSDPPRRLQSGAREVQRSLFRSIDIPYIDIPYLMANFHRHLFFEEQE